MGNHPDCRRSIIEVLQTLSSEERQIAYERNVPFVSVPTELVCMWFDDFYLPESDSFRRCFSPAELDSMSVFSRRFEQEIKRMPETVTELLKIESWQELMREAGTLLRHLQP
jgi:hypothetical protein